MKFEVINDRGRTIMSTTYISCIPNDREIASMIKAGYKFKFDGKSTSKNKIKDLIDKRSDLK